jgi:hypothetical protein
LDLGDRSEHGGERAHSFTLSRRIVVLYNEIAGESEARGPRSEGAAKRGGREARGPRSEGAAKRGGDGPLSCQRTTAGMQEVGRRRERLPSRSILRPTGSYTRTYRADV